MDDEEVIRAFQGGDEAAFSDLVDRYRRPVYRIARGILKNHAQADEAAQDAFVKAWQGLPSFRGDSTFKTWMYRIAMNAAFDFRAREATQARTREEAALRAIIDARPAPRRAIDELIDEEERKSMRAAVDGLPDKQRATLLLRIQDDLKYTEIAEVLGCHVGTVKANFHHAVKNLQEALGKQPLRGRQPLRGMRTLQATALAEDDGIPAGDAHDA